MAGKNSRHICVSIYSRHVRVIFEISRQNPKILLAEAKGAGGSFVHKAPNQKTDMSQKCVDFLGTQMSVDMFSTLDPLAEARGAGGRFVNKVPNQKKDMTQMRKGLAAVGVDSMVKYVV